MAHAYEVSTKRAQLLSAESELTNLHVAAATAESELDFCRLRFGVLEAERHTVGAKILALSKTGARIDYRSLGQAVPGKPSTATLKQALAEHQHLLDAQQPLSARQGQLETALSRVRAATANQQLKIDALRLELAALEQPVERPSAVVDSGGTSVAPAEVSAADRLLQIGRRMAEWGTP